MGKHGCLSTGTEKAAFDDNLITDENDRNLSDGEVMFVDARMCTNATTHLMDFNLIRFTRVWCDDFFRLRKLGTSSPPRRR
jgi:hypothetical protein